MLISIYMPTRNRIALLPQAIDSALSQTHKDIELIVVNDASSDGTDDFLARRAQADSRLIVLHNAWCQGAGASRNRAIRAARGDFVTGLDDDDAFMPERVAVFLEHWSHLASQGVAPSCLYSQDFKIRTGRDPATTQKPPSVCADDLFEGCLMGNQVFAPTHHFLKVGLFDETLPAWQDLEFFIRLLREFGPARLVDRPTYRINHTRRADRITAQEQNIRQACEMVSRLHAAGDPRKMKGLFLLQFFPENPITSTAADWVRLLRFGGWPHGMLRMWRAGRTR